MGVDNEKAPGAPWTPTSSEMESHRVRASITPTDLPTAQPQRFPLTLAFNDEIHPPLHIAIAPLLRRLRLR